MDRKSIVRPRTRLQRNLAELELLARLAEAEANIIKDSRKHTAIADVVNNRDAFGRTRRFGPGLTGIVNKWTATKDGRRVYEFSPLNDQEGWEERKVNTAVLQELARHHSEQAFGAPQSVPGWPTHYLNPDSPDSKDEIAPDGWASDWRQWPIMGASPFRHAFGIARKERHRPRAESEMSLTPDARQLLGTLYNPDAVVPRVPEAFPKAKSESPTTMAPLSVPLSNTWLGKLNTIAQSVAGIGPNYSSFDPRYYTPSTIAPMAPTSFGPIMPNIEYQRMLNRLRFDPLPPEPNEPARRR